MKNYIIINFAYFFVKTITEISEKSIDFYAKARSCYRDVSIPPNPAAQYFLLEVKTITKSPGNGIAESVKSCNLH